MSKITKKILLNSTGFYNQVNEDMFLDIQLYNSISEIKPYKYDNNFDLQKEFDSERNTSRDFILYGTIDSIVNITLISGSSFLELWKQISPPTIIIDSPSIESYVPQDIIVLNDNSILKYVQYINTSTLNYTSKNVFDVLKRKYYIELDNYSNIDQETLYLFVNGDMLNVSGSTFFVENQLFKQTIIFRDPDGNIIPYGTNDEFINNDGTSYSVNNDFPFFYNKHWVKQNITIERTYISQVTFQVTDISMNEGDIININVKLNHPTINDCIVNLDYFDLTTSPNDYEIIQDTITFLAGTDTAILSIKTNVDSGVEVSEKFKIVMTSFFNCTAGAITELDVTIMGTNITNFAVYNFQTMYKNLLSFGENNPNNNVLYSNLRDGYFIGDQDSQSFFPNDNYILTITNNGIDTIFPSNDEFNNNDFVFKSGTTLSYQLNNSYNGSTTQTLGVEINVNPFSQYSAIVNINGIIYTNIKTNTDLITALTSDSNVKNYDFSLQQTLDADGNVIEEYVLLTSNKPGIPIILKNLEDNLAAGEFIILDSSDPRFTSFIAYSQIPETIKLLSNSSDGQFCNYSFLIQKQGYKDVNIPSEPLNAISGGTTYYLTTGYGNINSAYENGDCFDPFDLNNNVNLITSYVNGVLFNYNSNNLTGIVYAEFLPKILDILPCTSQNEIGGFNISL